MKGKSFAVAGLVIALFLGFVPVLAEALVRHIDDGDRVVLPGNVPPLARSESDTGPVDPALPMERMVLFLTSTAQKQAELNRLLVDQQDPAAPDYHNWLSPEEFGVRFGAELIDIEAVAGWLTAQGFAIEEIGRGRRWINFSGRARDVERAFRVKIRNYRVNGALRHANAEDPTIPRGLSDLVGGVVSLHNFPRKAMLSRAAPAYPQGTGPQFTGGSTHYLAPGDFATIYNLVPLYAAGVDGSAQRIAIVGRTHPAESNWSTFRSSMGLTGNPPVVIVNGADPGDLGGAEDIEADLDVEWSGAVAKNSTIYFVTSKSTGATDGVDLSAQYIVDNNLAPVMSTSFGQCEASLGRSERNFYNSLWQQAAAQGITTLVSSGDSGAAGCDAGSDTTGTVTAVNGLASTPFNVAVGGTQFAEGAGSYWGSTNEAGYTSALSYIPESAWNESGSVPGGSELWSSGGGASAYYQKPSWQAALGVPSDGRRDLPDVSLSAGKHDGYLVQTLGTLYAVGGTSASSPALAGIMALIVQKSGQRQGNVNPRLYQLGNAQYGGGGVAVFHDTISGNNTVPGVSGFSSTVGYDLATGLGSVDAHALVTHWVPGFTITPTSGDLSVDQRSLGTATVAASFLGNYSGTATLSASGLPAGAGAVFAPAAITTGAANTTLTISIGSTTPPGSYQVTITASDGILTKTATLNLTVVAVYDLNASVTGAGGTISPTVTTARSGSKASFVVAPAQGYHLAALTDNGADVTSLVSSGSYTIAAVTAPHTLLAAFTADTFSVTTTITSGEGTVSPTWGTVTFGGNLTFSIVPAAGFQVGSVTDNGVGVVAVKNGGVNTYVIENATTSHAIAISFDPLPAQPVPALPQFGLAAVAVCWVMLMFQRKQN